LLAAHSSLSAGTLATTTDNILSVVPSPGTRASIPGEHQGWRREQ
jgi:hypothetical protein